MITIKRKLSLSAMILTFIGSAITIPKVVAEEVGYTLEKVVILSRHGVRSPTKQTELMNEVTPDKWPEWPVKAGYLTPRGEHLVKIMGHFYGQYFRHTGLLPKERCPAEGQVYVYSDIDQRTLLTGQALIDGIAPQCGFKIFHQKNLKQIDPLFHPVEAGICALNAKKTQEAIEKKLGAPITTLSQRYAKSLALMGKVLNFSASPYCQKMEKQGMDCNFADLSPNEVQVNQEGSKASLSGPVALSSTLAEIFLLQNSQGMPIVAWHRLLTREDWQTLMLLHNSQFDLMAKTPYIAQHKGTPLLQQINVALLQPEQGKAGLDKQPATKKTLSNTQLPDNNAVFILGGHDTNIANVAGMLGLNWTLPLQPDNTPPGGGLVFERWRDQHGQSFVAIKMFYQTLNQLRNMEKLDLSINPAGMVSIDIPGCENEGENKLCRLATFQKKVVEAIEPACNLP
ncbi:MULTISPECIES: AppA family phytase/histidine-type acid phosphatase [Yersinia]|uniref:AppA family phytase/histidine-type acid phosphatase n=1 Tax=Yersinia TaxID=629 RepID=UPI000EB2C276|nr:AppA family phytase/histidine-type acid phosphatase [Yersinia sp. IP36721]